MRMGMRIGRGMGMGMRMRMRMRMTATMTMTTMMLLMAMRMRMRIATIMTLTSLVFTSSTTVVTIRDLLASMFLPAVVMWLSRLLPQYLSVKSCGGEDVLDGCPKSSHDDCAVPTCLHHDEQDTGQKSFGFWDTETRLCPNCSRQVHT